MTKDSLLSSENPILAWSSPAWTKKTHLGHACPSLKPSQRKKTSHSKSSLPITAAKINQSGLPHNSMQRLFMFPEKDMALHLWEESNKPRHPSFWWLMQMTVTIFWKYRSFSRKQRRVWFGSRMQAAKRWRKNYQRSNAMVSPPYWKSAFHLFGEKLVQFANQWCLLRDESLQESFYDSLKMRCTGMELQLKWL